MVFLKAKNPEITDNERTQVRVAAAAAAVSIDVDNTQGFAANDFIVIGTLGTETCEAVRITAITDDDTLAVTATKFAHLVDEPVVKALFDQVRFYSSADSFAAAISTSNIEWDNPNRFTQYNDTSGTSSTTYKFSYYNSNSAVSSDLSLEFSVPTYYCSVQDVADYLNLDVDQVGEVKTHQVQKLISRATEEVDMLTGTSFTTQTITSSNYEYIDGGRTYVRNYFLKNKPIIAVSTLQITTSDESVGPTDATWTTLTENTNFVVYKETATIGLIDELNLPDQGKFRMRVAYTWGYATIPEEIRLLATLLVSRHLMYSGVARSAILGRDGTAGPNVNVLDAEIDRIVSRYRFGGIENA